MAVLFIFAVGAVLIRPVLGATQSDSGRAVCFNNLRQIGRAAHTWAELNTSRLLPWWIHISEGGTKPAPSAAWLQFASFSNELVTPKILACPSDVGVRKSVDWDRFAIVDRQAALSYVIGLHALPESPRAWLSGDRNLRFDSVGGACATGLSGVTSLSRDPGITVARWTNGVVHGEFGHLLLNDGSVEFTSSDRLRDLISDPAADMVNDGSTHYLPAR